MHSKKSQNRVIPNFEGMTFKDDILILYQTIITYKVDIIF